MEKQLLVNLCNIYVYLCVHIFFDNLSKLSKAMKKLYNTVILQKVHSSNSIKISCSFLIKPVERCHRSEPVPRRTPSRNSPGPLVNPRYGRLNISVTPFPTLLTSPVGLPRISNDPTSKPARNTSINILSSNN